MNERLRVRIQLLWPRRYPEGDAWYVLKKYKPSAELVLLAQMRDEHTAEGFMLLDIPAFRALPPWLGAESLHGNEALMRDCRALVSALRDLLNQNRDDST